MQPLFHCYFTIIMEFKCYCSLTSLYGRPGCQCTPDCLWQSASLLWPLKCITNTALAPHVLLVLLFLHFLALQAGSVACMADRAVTIRQPPVIVCGTSQDQYATCNVYPTQLPILYVGP
jgi:hypothetical protein